MPSNFAVTFQEVSYRSGRKDPIQQWPAPHPFPIMRGVDQSFVLDPALFSTYFSCFLINLVCQELQYDVLVFLCSHVMTDTPSAFPLLKQEPIES